MHFELISFNMSQRGFFAAKQSSDGNFTKTTMIQRNVLQKSDHNEMNILSLESRKESNKWNTIIIIFVCSAVISRANLKCILN